MKLRSGRTTGNNTCTLYSPKCCAELDKRPKQVYIAYNKSYFSDVSIVPRDYYYCAGCKKVR